jgi:hypothetical protein
MVGQSASLANPHQRELTEKQARGQPVAATEQAAVRGHTAVLGRSVCRHTGTSGPLAFVFGN